MTWAEQSPLACSLRAPTPNPEAEGTSPGSHLHRSALPCRLLRVRLRVCVRVRAWGVRVRSCVCACESVCVHAQKYFRRLSPYKQESKCSGSCVEFHVNVKHRTAMSWPPGLLHLQSNVVASFCARVLLHHSNMTLAVVI